MYLRNGYCIEYDMFALDFWNQYNNFLCEVDKAQQANFWGPFREVISDTSDSWGNVVSPSFIGTAIFVVVLSALAVLIWLTYRVIKSVRWHKVKLPKKQFRAPKISPSVPQKKKPMVAQASVDELKSELFCLINDERNGARASSLLARVNRFLDKDGHYVQSVEAFSARQGLTELRDRFEALAQEELEPSK